jgi:flagellar motor switch protein FliG
MNKPLSSEAVRKAAILVAALDTASADALLDKLDPQQARRVRDAVMQLDIVSSTEEAAVLSDFLRDGGRQPETDMAGVELDESLARKLAEPQPPSAVAEPSRPAQPAQPFRLLQQASPETLARHLFHEHPQTIAVVVAHLPHAQAAQLIRHFPPPLQAGVLRRVAELDSTDPAVLQTLEQQLETLLSDEIRAARNRSMGVTTVVSILAASGADRRVLMDSLVQHDQQFAALVQKQPGSPAVERPSQLPVPRIDAQPQQPATPHAAHRSDSPQKPPLRPAATGDAAKPDLDQLLQLDDRRLAHVFAQLPADVTLLALAGASEPLVARLERQLPAREARSLRRRIQQFAPVRLRDIERAQREVAAVASRIEG